MSFRRKVWNVVSVSGLFYLAAGIWLAGIPADALAQSDLPPFAYTFTPSIAKITITPAANWNLFRPADTINIATSDGGSIRILDLNGNLIYSGAPKSIQLPVGHYFVETPGDRAEFGVLPQDLPKLSLIGVHDTGSWPTGDQLKAQLQPTWERAGAGYWSRVQPVSSNAWDWSQIDAAFQLLAPTGRKVIYLGGADVPTWLTPGTDFTAYTNQVIRCWTNFVGAALQRYGSQMYAFEIWNEPGHYALGVTNDAQVYPFYLTIAQATKTVRDRVAPQVKLLGPSWNGIRGTASTAQWLLDRGINDCIDIWSWHEFGDGAYAPDQDYLNIGWPPSYALPDRIGLNLPGALVHKPLNVGELGIFGRSALGCPPPTEGPGIYNSGLPWRGGYRRVIKMMNMYQAAGVSSIIPHVAGSFCQYPGSNWEIYGFDQGSTAIIQPRGPHPKTTALLMTNYWLNNAVLKDQRRPGRQYFLYAWQRPDNTAVVFAWTMEGTTQALTPSLLPPAQDLFGRSITPTQLTEEPILFTTNAPAASALMQRVLAALPVLNNPPVWATINNQSVNYGQPLQFQMTASDPDLDPLTYSVSPLPAGASVNPQTGMFTWTPGSSQMGTYPITCTATDARGLSATTTTIISVLGASTNGLVARWKFDESSGTTAADSARANTGTLSGFDFTAASGWTAGRWGNALRFDGINDTVMLNPASPDLNLTNNFTITLWVNPQDPVAERQILSLRSLYAASGLQLWVVGNELRVMGQTTTGWHGMRWAPGALPSPGWYHVVVMCDKSTIRVYVNGVAQPTDAGANPYWGGDFVVDPTGHTELGGESLYSSYFAGMLDDIRIYNRCLSDAEITSLQSQVDPPPVNHPPVLNPIPNQSAAAGGAIGVTMSASDADADGLTYSTTAFPAGASFDPVNRMFWWGTTTSQVGTYSPTFQVSDGQATASQTVTLTVTSAPVNHPPVLNPIPNQTVAAGGSIGFTVTGSDPDGNPLSYSASGVPAGATFNSANQVFNWTTTTNQAGTYNVTFQVSDGQLTASQIVTMAVTNSAPVNHPPVLNPIPNQTVAVGGSIGFTVTGSDPDGNALTYSASGVPTGATFNPANHVFNWITATNQVGTYNVTFQVSDGQLSASQIVMMTVTNSAPINHPPVLNPIPNQSVAAGGSIGFTVTGSDPDGNALTYSASGVPTGALFNPANHVFNWTTTTNQAGTYNVTFQVSDGQLSASQIVIMTVTGTISTNHPPVLNPISNQSVAAGGSIGFTVTGSDPDGNALTYSASGVPTGATFNPANHVFNWITATNQVGTYNVTFQVSDGQLSASQIVMMTVTNSAPINHPPVLNPIPNQSVAAGGSIGFTVTGSDPDGNALTYSASGVPTGALFNPANHVFNWTTTTNQAGTYNVTFQVSDGQLSASQIVIMTVTGTISTNHPPVLNPISNQSVAAGGSIGFTVTGSDPDGNALTYSASGVPTGATFNPANQVFNWITATNQVGTYNVTFQVSDGQLSASQIVTMTVTNSAPINHPPVLNPISNQSVAAGGSIGFTVTGSDPDGNALTYSASGVPTGALFNPANHVFNWTTTTNQAGTYNVTFQVSDGQLSASQIVIMTVTGTISTNHPPVLNPISNQSVAAGGSIGFTVTGSDPDGNALTYSASGVPTGALFNPANHVFNWTTTTNQAGTYNVTFQVSDGQLTASQIVTMTVTGSAPVNRPPVLNPIPNQTVAAGQTLSFTVSASDPDGNTLSYSATGLPANATFSTTSGAFSWLPATAQVGAYPVIFAVSDGSLSVSQKVALVVTDPSTGLIANWPLDEGTGTTITNVLNGDSGTLVNFNFNTISGWVNWQGIEGSTSALAFDGVDDNVVLNSTRLGVPNNLTIYAWVFPTDLSVTRTILAIQTRSGASGLRLVHESGFLKAEGETTVGFKSTSFTGVALTPSAWNFIAVAYDQSTVRGYVNGVSAGSAAWGGDLRLDNTAPSRLGYEYSQYLKGGLDDVQIYGRVVSATEIAAYYNATLNQPPVLAPIGPRSVTAKQTLTFTISASDPDGDPLTYTATNLPSGASFNTATRTFSWSTKAPNVGTYVVTFTVSDGQFTDSEAVTITVTR